MKTLFVITLFLGAGVNRMFAQWAVIDAAGLQQSIMQYSTMIEQLSKQATQISNQVQQIKRMDTQLSRMGDMASVTVVVGFPQLHNDMQTPTKTKTWNDILQGVNGSGIFGDTRGGIYRDVTPTFPDFDGSSVSRDPDIYKVPHDITASVDNHKDVQSDVYARREALKVAIAQTAEAVRTATTDAEATKQQAILEAQYNQLSMLESEAALSAAEIQVKVAEASAMDEAQRIADAESRGQLARQESEKVKTTFKPAYECLLQYVSEVSLQPQ